MKLMSESEERYLKTVYMLAKSQGEVRSVDIASVLGYSKASVSRAMKILRENGYVVMPAYGQIYLTPAGMTEARNIVEREFIISGFLWQTLALDDELAAKYSANLAHLIDQDTLNKMKLEVPAACKTKAGKNRYPLNQPKPSADELFIAYRG